MRLQASGWAQQRQWPTAAPYRAFCLKSIHRSLSWPLWVDASFLELYSEGYESLGSIFLIQAGEVSPNEPETLRSANRQLPGDSSVQSHCCLHSHKSTGHLIAPSRSWYYANFNMSDKYWESLLKCMVLGSALRNADSVGHASGRGI